MIECLGEKEIQIEREDKEKEEDVNICVKQSDEKKIEDEFFKEVLIGLLSIQIKDHQFEFNSNHPKELIAYNSWRTCYLSYYLHHNGKDSRTNHLEEEGNDVIRIALPRSKICIRFEVFIIQVVVPQ